ncbi:MAG: hypothetical protein HYY84_12590 [Deltaproteobacteria bacterium]|nr:hypothetical protein [Deltaproteobacteria bacterium]
MSKLCPRRRTWGVGPCVIGFVLLTAACGTTVNWRNHVAFRSTGTKLEYSTFDRDEIARTAISTNLHYVSISLDSVFFRNLPGIGDADVAFGFEITGVLGDGKTIKTVLDSRKGVGEHAFLNFDNLVVIEPFLYKGENVTINFHFTAVPGPQSQFIRAQLVGPLGDSLKKINPIKDSGVAQGVSMFANVFGGFAQKTWNYGTTFFPSDRVYRDKPDLLFTASRHILMATPPADAPAKFKELRPNTLMSKLKMRGNRLVWEKTDEEFTDLPYIVLNITRYKRYPKTDTKLRQTLQTIDAHIENGSLELAQSSLQGVGAIISDDVVITATEKNLERSLVKWREERIKSLKAKKDDQKDTELTHVKKELEHLFFTLNEFHKILEPFEIKDMLFRLNERLQRADELMRDQKEPPELLAPFKAKYEMMAKKFSDDRPPEILPVGPAVTATAPPTPPSTIETSSGSILKKWWFWTAIGAAAGTGVALYFILRDQTVECKGVVVGTSTSCQ